MTLAIEARPDRTLAAAGCILGYAVVIAFIDNFVRDISQTMSLWQFQAMRSGLSLMIFAGLLALPFAIRLRPVNPGAVAARALVQTVGMLIYFASLGWMTVAQVAAGLFTAPIFVLLIGRLVYGHSIGPARIVAAVIGFAGVLMVLAPDPANLGPATLLPVVAGAFYALTAIATREWCGQESAATLTLSYMVVMGLAGCIGMAVLWWLAPVGAPGPDGFLTHAAIWPDGWLTLILIAQAIGSVLGVALMVRAYQLAEANRVAVFEYVMLPVSAIWSWLLWGQTIGLVAVAGMGLIIAAGAVIALRAPRP